MIRKYLKEKNAAFHITCACAVLSIVAGVLAMVLPNLVDGVSISATSGIIAIAGAAAFVVMVLVDYIASFLRYRKGDAEPGINFVRLGTVFMAVLVFVSFIVLAAESAEFLVSGITDYTMDSSGGIFGIPGIVEIGVCLVALLVLAILGNVMYWVPSHRDEAAKIAKREAKIARKNTEEAYESYIVQSGEYLKGKNGAFYVVCTCAALSLIAGILTIVLPYGVDGASVSSTPGLIAIVAAFAFIAMAFCDYIDFYIRYRKYETEYGVNFVRLGTVFMAILVFVSFILLAAESAEFLVSGITDYTMDSSGGIFGIPGIVEIGVCLVILLVLAIIGNILYWVPSRRKISKKFIDYGLSYEDNDLNMTVSGSTSSTVYRGGRQV